MTAVIHPTALVSQGAELGRGVSIGPFTIIGPKVVIEDDVTIGSHVVIDGRTRVGTGTSISPFASLGSVPQDLKYRGEDSELFIGSGNKIREYCNISLGTEGGGGKTVIGNNNLFMVNSHVAHDCIIADDCIIANAVAIAGHVVMGSRAVLGGLSAVHQFCRIGDLAMIAGGAMVVQDVPPYCTVQGDRAKPAGLNVVGLRRLGLSAERLSDVKAMYRLTYRENLPTEEAVRRIAEELPVSDERELFLAFLRASDRGICR